MLISSLSNSSDGLSKYDEDYEIYLSVERTSLVSIAKS